MTRISKQEERRMRSPRKRRAASPKTGSKKDDLPLGYKEHASAVQGELAGQIFVPKVR